MTLNSIALARIRGNAYRWLKDVCIISHDAKIQDELGSTISVKETIASNVPCRIYQAGTANNTASEIIGNAESLKEPYKIAIPNSYELSVDYQITSGGVTYDVIRIETALTDEIFTMALITRHR